MLNKKKKKKIGNCNSSHVGSTWYRTVPCDNILVIDGQLVRNRSAQGDPSIRGLAYFDFRFDVVFYYWKMIL